MTRHPVRRPSANRAVVALPVLAILLVGGCSDEPETVDRQNVGVCVPSTSERPSTGRIDVDFRQDGTTVASASTTFGGAVAAEVPSGEIQVYVNGEYYGMADSMGPGVLDEDGKLSGGIYLGGPGCPAADQVMP